MVNGHVGDGVVGDKIHNNAKRVTATGDFPRVQWLVMMARRIPSVENFNLSA